MCHGKYSPCQGVRDPLSVLIYRGFLPINLQLTRASKTAIPLRDSYEPLLPHIYNIIGITEWESFRKRRGALHFLSLGGEEKKKEEQSPLPPILGTTRRSSKKLVSSSTSIKPSDDAGIPRTRSLCEEQSYYESLVTTLATPPLDSLFLRQTVPPRKKPSI